VEQNKEDRRLEDLFRQKLENAEVIPSPAAGKSLMRRVSYREFLRFNPSRMNIWYAGTIAVAGAALAIILASGPREEKVPSEPDVFEIHSNVPVNAVVADVSDNDRPYEADKRTGRSEGRTAELNDRITDRSEAAGSDAAGRLVPVTVSPPDGLGRSGSQDHNNLKLFTGKGSYIGTSVTEGCCPVHASFRCTAAVYDSCKWNFGDGGYSFLGNPSWLFDMAGEYNVTLEVYASGERHLSSVIIKVHSKPEARFEIIRESTGMNDDEVVFRNYSERAQRYRWDFGDGTGSDQFEPTHTYNRQGNYNVRLIAVSEYGCSDSMLVENAFSGSGCFIDFPNAFIPNPTGPSGGYYSPKSDEASRVFHPFFSGVGDYQLRIFSRRGILIFESNDINYGWDGYYNGQLCDPGVYVWKVRGNFINSEPFTRMGDVTLLNN
jgi:PKD repeat protein